MKPWLKSKFQKYWPILTLLALTLIFFWPLLFAGKTYFFGEFLTRYYPWKVFYSKSLAQGQFPLWAPNIGLGYPLLAGGEIGALYLPNLILYKFLPVIWAYNLSFVFHFFLAALFMYFFARTLELCRASSLIAGLIFVYSGYMTTHIYDLPIITALPYLPLILVFLNLYFKNSRTLYLVGAATAWALQFYAGAFAISVITALTAVFYAFFPSLWKSVKEKNLSYFRQDFIWVFCTALLALLLSLAQILPLYELMSFSLSPNESSVVGPCSTSIPMGWELICTLFFPFFCLPPTTTTFNQSWWIMVYLGLIPLGLAFYGLWQRTSKVQIFFLLLLFLTGIPIIWFIIGALLSFVDSHPIGFFLPRFYHLLAVATFAMAILAAFGFERLCQTAYKINDWWKFLFLIPLGFPIISHYNQVRLVTNYNYLNFFPLISFSLFVIMLCSHKKFLKKLRLHKKKKLWPQILFSFTFILICADLFLFGLSFNPLTNLLVIKEISRSSIQLQPEPEVVRFDPRFGFFGLWDPLPEGLNLVNVINYGLPQGTLRLKREHDLYYSTSHNDYEVNSFLEFLNVKYSYERNCSNPASITIQINPYFKPRAYIAKKVETIKDEKTILKKIYTPEFLEGDKLILEEEPPAGLIPPVITKDEKKGEILNLTYGDQKVILRVSMQQKGWLVLKDNYYPGWEAWVDGKQTKIYRGNYTMRAIFLEAGNHQVEFIYRPKVFKWGMVMTILGILVAVKLSWWSIKKQGLGIRNQGSDKI